MAGNVWKPTLMGQVISGWDTFAHSAVEARNLIAEQMMLEGYEATERAWFADGAKVQPLEELVEIEA